MMEGRVVLVTGSAKGIGRHIAHTFAAEGASLALADIEPLDRVTGELGELGVNVLPLKTDIRDEAEVKAMVDRVLDRFGKIDVLINNAGIVTHFSWATRWPRIRDMEQSFWSNVLDTNLGGTFLCTKHVLPNMEERRSGHIVNLYGGADPLQMGTGACAYGVSKEAIRKFTGFVAEEERPWNICVTAISPGAAIATEDASEEAKRTLPGPDFVGNAFVLASQVSLELSGQLLGLRDGRLAVVPS